MFRIIFNSSSEVEWDGKHRDWNEAKEISASEGRTFFIYTAFFG